jgi:hypothetical protein
MQVLKRTAPAFVPILFAAFPLLSLFVENQTDVELSILWWPLAWCMLAAIALYGGFALITRRSGNAGVLASLVVVAFFYWGLASDRASGWGIDDRLFFAVWLVVLVAGLVAVLRTRRDLASLALILGVGAAVMTVPTLVRLVNYQADNPSLSASDPRLWPTALAEPSPPSGAPLPDIYVIEPDDYERSDVLKKYFHHDDSGFLRELKKRGFVVSDQARSPYSDSESNTASLVNMDYLSEFPRILGKNSEDGRPVKRVSEDNRAARLLKGIGYRYVHLDTDEVSYAGGNPDLSSAAVPDSLTNLWLQKTILKRLGGPLGFNQHAIDERFRDSVRWGFSALADVPRQPGPKFVVFHTLLPHDPYVFGAQGQSVTFPLHGEEDLASGLGRAYYVRQLQLTQRKLLESVDQILARSKTPPVVVVQSDEGFSANDTPFGEEAALQMRVKGLSAFHLPGRPRAGVPQPPNTVNDLRFVFNEYLGTHYPMLRSASYPEGDLPYQFEEMRVK